MLPRALAAMFLLAFSCLSGWTCADERHFDNTTELLGRRVEDRRLDEVRAGSQAADLGPQHLSVILWDEPRVPPPPVRNTAGDARVTGQMNTYTK